MSEILIWKICGGITLICFVFISYSYGYVRGKRAYKEELEAKVAKIVEKYKPEFERRGLK